jgi:hypothetical protein
VQAVQFVVLFVGLIVVWRGRVRAARRSGENFGFHIYNLTIILMLSLFFYRSSGYYRIFAIHLLVTLLLLIGFKHYRLVGIFIIIGLIGAPVFFNNYKGQHDFSFHPERDAVKLDSMRATFEQEMVYKPDASNAWCNTVLIPTQFLDYHVLAVPAKIGISFLWFGDVNFPLKSHYLLFDEATYQDMRNRLRIEPLAVVSDATLYRNLDSGCVDG